MDPLASFALNLSAGLAMGTIIGLERQFGQHTAGLRTNALVCVGAALFVSLAQLTDSKETARMAAQVVSGLGFLGGGVILREGFNVRGMNTAATLWCSGAIGTLAGAGLLWHGAIGTLVVVVLHLALRPVVRAIELRKTLTGKVESHYRVRVVCQSSDAALIRSVFMRHINSETDMTIQGLATQDTDRADTRAVVAEIFSLHKNDKIMNELVSRMSIEPSVTGVSWEHLNGINCG